MISSWPISFWIGLEVKRTQVRSKNSKEMRKIKEIKRNTRFLLGILQVKRIDFNMYSVGNAENMGIIREIVLKRHELDVNIV